MTYVSFVNEDVKEFPDSARVNKYHVNEVVGTGPIDSGSKVTRIESGTPLETGLRGVVQHLHYTTVDERTDLTARSRTELPPASGTTAVLIPIRKSAAWWALAHDERGAYFHKAHTQIGAPYVETIFRKLYHSRYLGSPYDFLTYFEFPNDSADYFRQLLKELRETSEWRYVEDEFEAWMTKLS